MNWLASPGSADASASAARTYPLRRTPWWKRTLLNLVLKPPVRTARRLSGPWPWTRTRRCCNMQSRLLIGSRAMSDLGQRLQDIFRDVFNDPALAVNDRTTAADVEGWDSLAHINLVIAIERALSIRF